VRLNLAAKAKGESPSELDSEESAWLEAELPKQKLPPDALDTLGQKRAAVLAEALVKGKGVEAARVTVGAPAPARSLPIPGVAIGVGARSSAPAE